MLFGVPQLCSMPTQTRKGIKYKTFRVVDGLGDKEKWAGNEYIRLFVACHVFKWMIDIRYSFLLLLLKHINIYCMYLI
jgi:hypothetical protein